MEFQTAIGRLERFVRVVNRAIIGVKVFEAFLVVLIGVATGFLLDSNGDVRIPVLVGLLISVAVYLLSLIVQIAYAANFPGSITEELKSAKELERLSEQAERQRALSGLLVQVMQQLNSQTCDLGSSGDSHLCSDGVSEGVGKLLSPLTQNINLLLGTTTSHAMVGLHLDHYCTLSTDEWISSTCVLSDTIGLRGLVPSDLLDSDDLQGAHFEVYSAVRKSVNNFAFVQHDFADDNGRELTIYCSPMPVACNEETILGVLFVTLPHQDEQAPDLEENMTIFGRVVANWVYRYNDCVRRRRESGLAQQANTLPRFRTTATHSNSA